MGSKYTTQTQSGYNTSPPPDDGSTTPSNKITWAKIKTALADVVLTLSQAINTALVSFTDFSQTAASTNYTTVGSDHCKSIECTNAITISLMDAASAGAGYIVTVTNVGAGVVTVALATGANTLDGTAGGSLKLRPNDSITLKVNAAATGYYSEKVGFHYTSDTFTPTISFGGGTTGITYTQQSGIYRRLPGGMVWFKLQIVLSSKGSSSGTLSVNALPLTPAADSIATAVPVRLSGSLGSIAVCQAYVNAGAATISIEKLVAGSSTALADTDIGNTSQITISGTYAT